MPPRRPPQRRPQQQQQEKSSLGETKWGPTQLVLRVAAQIPYDGGLEPEQLENLLNNVLVPSMDTLAPEESEFLKERMAKFHYTHNWKFILVHKIDQHRLRQALSDWYTDSQNMERKRVDKLLMEFLYLLMVDTAQREKSVASLSAAVSSIKRISSDAGTEEENEELDEIISSRDPRRIIVEIGDWIEDWEGKDGEMPSRSITETADLFWRNYGRILRFPLWVAFCATTYITVQRLTNPLYQLR
eukprot:TRINITY_DN11391_c0_g1_i1.p1 TRINITY_DN11391_c0_g1~~TRINITY_DN11391_c0_g1_i1.p1  ORF type:complete len:244 (-),score=69.00 TRINITY_DN11391_c0_g1_i1:159-890(-)